MGFRRLVSVVGMSSDVQYIRRICTENEAESFDNKLVTLQILMELQAPEVSVSALLVGRKWHRVGVAAGQGALVRGIFFGPGARFFCRRLLPDSGFLRCVQVDELKFKSWKLRGCLGFEPESNVN